MSSDAIDIRHNIHDCEIIFKSLKRYIKENDVEFTDLEVFSLSFNLDELRLLIDTFQKEMDSRMTMEVMEKLI